MNFSTFFSIFLKLCYKHFVMVWKVSVLETKAIFFSFWLPYPQSPVVRTPTDWRNGFGTLIDKNHVYPFSFFYISSKEFSAYRIKKIVALEMGYTLGSCRMHFQKRISRRGKVGQLFSPPFLYFQNEMTVIGKNQDSRMSKDFVMECRRGLDFCVFLSGIWEQLVPI